MAEPTTQLHDETEEKQPKIIIKPTLISPVTIEELPVDDGHS